MCSIAYIPDAECVGEAWMVYKNYATAPWGRAGAINLVINGCLYKVCQV